jgi:branched-chain amino acid transport system substrate-binding protein
VPLINQAVIVVGSDSLHKTVGTKIPTLLTSPTLPSDFTSPDVYTMIGGSSAILTGMAFDAHRSGAKTAAVLGVSNSAGMFAVTKLFVPSLTKYGVKSKVAFFPDAATTPEMVSALQAAGAETADVVEFVPSGPQNCTSVYNGMKQLGLSKPVIATLLCNADSFISQTGGGPSGCHIWTFDANPRLTSDPHVRAYNDVMSAYHQSSFANAGQAIQGFSDVLVIAKLANAIWPNLTPQAFKQQIEGFKGPVPFNAGTIDCGYNKMQPTLCGNAAEGSVFKNGAWQSIGAFKLGP